MLSCIAIEQSNYSENLGALTAVLSGAVMYGVVNNSTLNTFETEELEKSISDDFGVDSEIVELYLISRFIHILKEISGVIFTPLLLVTKMLPKLNEICVAIEMSSFNDDE